MKKKTLEQQRDHLGGHLKNMMVHVDDLNFRILDECQKAWGIGIIQKRTLFGQLEVF